MSSRKSSVFLGTLIGLVCLVAGMVIASRLDLTPRSLAGNLNVPATNSAPLTGALDASTFRTIAHDQSPAVVSILTTGRRPAQPAIQALFQGPRRQGQGGGPRHP